MAPVAPRPQQYGLMTFTFDESKPLGLHLEMCKQGKDGVAFLNVAKKDSALIVSSVVPGGAAHDLDVPIGGQITGVNGKSKSATELWQALQNSGLGDRPLSLNIYLQPPGSAKEHKPKGKRRSFLMKNAK